LKDDVVEAKSQLSEAKAYTFKTASAHLDARIRADEVFSDKDSTSSEVAEATLAVNSVL